MDSLHMDYREPKPRQEAGGCVRPLVQTYHCTRWEAEVIEAGSKQIAEMGGPDAAGAAEIAAICGRTISARWPTQKRNLAQHYTRGDIAAIVFDHLPTTVDDALPSSLPDIATLEAAPQTRFLAARNQVLLALLNERAFAFDIDNHAKITRLVANFKGGGLTKVEGEERGNAPGLSSHHGVALGAHTEAPYYATTESAGEHSPAPTTLILSARWNPGNEATTIIPIQPILDKLGGLASLGLGLSYYGFSRSDSFTSDDDASPRHVRVIDLLPDGRVAIRYNDYRIFPEPTAPPMARQALEEFRRQLAKCIPVKVNLQPSRAVAINNYAALHARDVVMDNRRLLIRLFGYAADVRYITVSTDPLVVRG